MAIKNNTVAVADGGGSLRDRDSTYKAYTADSVAAKRNAAAQAQTADRNNQQTTTTSGSGKTINTNAINTAVKGITDGINKVVNAATSSGGGGGGGGGSSSAPAATPNYDTTVPNVFGDTVDPELLSEYQKAMSALENMKGQTPTYGNRYDEQIQSLYQQIMNRGPFKYDSKTDPLYQQYVQDYTMQGKMAMKDTIGQAAGLTGGYGSSYGQAVGQAVYDQYLQKLADVLPETYGMALDAYNAEGNRLNQNLSTTVGLEQSDYSKYLDKLNQYNTDLDRAYAQEDLAYNRMNAKEKENYNRQLDQLDIQGNNYNRLVNLIAMGYKPTKADYNAAGLSEAQGAALLGAYMPQAKTVYVSTGGTNNGGGNGGGGDGGDGKIAGGQGIPYSEYAGYMRAITTGGNANAAAASIPQSAWNNMTDAQKKDLQAALQRKMGV